MANDKAKPTTRPRAINDGTALARRKARRQNRNNGTAAADWQSVDPNLLQSLVATVTQLGTVTFGYTRDGGAYYIQYWVDGESLKEYVRPTEDIDAVLEAEIESWK